MLSAAAVLFISCKDCISGCLPDYTVNDISFDFKTTKSFDKAALQEIMFLPKTMDFNQDELERDRERLKKFYFDNGFFDSIIDTSVTYDQANNEVDIVIIIIEKTRYAVKEILIGGLNNIAPNIKEEINADPVIKAGDFYFKANITNETNRILDILQNNGYLNARTDTIFRTEVAKYSAEVQKNPVYKYSVRVKITFAGVDKQYFFGTTIVNIVNNKYSLQKDIIQRELKYKVGGLYNKGLIVESERNFTKLAIIQLGRIQIDTVIENAARVNMVVNITLNTKYQVTPGIVGKFIDNYFYFGGGIQYDDKNFFGGGRVLSVGLEPLYHNRDINKVELTSSLFQPYLFRDNVTANLSVSAQYKNFNEVFQYLILSNALTLNYYTRPWVFYKTLSAQLTVDLLRIKYKQSFFDQVDNVTIRQDSIQNLLNSVIGFTATHNNTNNLFNPSAGFFHSFTLEDAGLVPFLLNRVKNNINYSQYFKFSLLNYFYFDISSGLASKIFAISSRIGDIIEYGKSSNIVPIQSQYKFFSGGGNSVRGWRAQDNGILANKLNGGNFLLEGSFELRWMMFNTSHGILKDVGTVYFFDYGNVWETQREFKFKQIALAAGFGVRYYTFVGPVRIDIGFKLYDPSAIDGKKWLFNYSLKDIFTIPRYSIQFGLGNAF